MAELTTADMALIDTLFGMYSGWVLDFSNSRFQSFFVRDVGVDIYKPRFEVYGTSKGKRLRAFLEIAPSAYVVKALTALWDVRESERLGKGEEEKVPHARMRLNALVTRLGGKPLPACFDEPAPPSPAWAQGPQ